MVDSIDRKKRAGFVALLGSPNAGKSTLLNSVVGEKISIVTRKVQTTRSKVQGIVMQGDAQIIFVDTPGLFDPKRRLDKAMVDAAWTAARESDVIVLLIDVTRPPSQEDYEPVLKKIKQARGNKPAILCLNKIDLISKPDLLPLTERLFDPEVFSDVLMVSALKENGLEDLKNLLAEKMPFSEWLYPPDDISDMPLRLMAAEITREKLFDLLHQELPYSLTVETEHWEEEDNRFVISQTIYVTRPGHKGIVLGKGGSKIKSIRIAAAQEIQKFCDKKVRLELFVKVREGWMDDPHHYKIWGLDYNA